MIFILYAILIIFSIPAHTSALLKINYINSTTELQVEDGTLIAQGYIISNINENVHLDISPSFKTGENSFEIKSVNGSNLRIRIETENRKKSLFRSGTENGMVKKSFSIVTHGSQSLSSSDWKIKIELLKTNADERHIITSHLLSFSSKGGGRFSINTIKKSQVFASELKNEYNIATIRLTSSFDTFFIIKPGLLNGSIGNSYAQGLNPGNRLRYRIKEISKKSNLTFTEINGTEWIKTTEMKKNITFVISTLPSQDDTKIDAYHFTFDVGVYFK